MKEWKRKNLQNVGAKRSGKSEITEETNTTNVKNAEGNL